MWKCFIGALCFCMMGCSQSSPSNEYKFPIPDNISPEAKKLISEAWPKVNKACPGLGKYGDVISFDSIDDSLKSEYAEYKKVSVRLKMPDNANAIPFDYYAIGHYCNFDISPDGKRLSIQKTPCQSVCLERPVRNNKGEDLVLNLE